MLKDSVLRGIVRALARQTTPGANATTLVFPLYSGTWLSGVQRSMKLSEYPLEFILLNTLPLAACIDLLRFVNNAETKVTLVKSKWVSNSSRATRARFPAEWLPSHTSFDKVGAVFTPYQLLVARFCAELGYAPRLLIDGLFPMLIGQHDVSSIELATNIRKFYSALPLVTVALPTGATELLDLHWSGLPVDETHLVRYRNGQLVRVSALAAVKLAPCSSHRCLRVGLS